VWNVVRQEQYAWDNVSCMHDVAVDHKSIKKWISFFLCLFLYDNIMLEELNIIIF
jgi:hypothetical protein